MENTSPNFQHKITRNKDHFESHRCNFQQKESYYPIFISKQRYNPDIFVLDEKTKHIRYFNQNKKSFISSENEMIITKKQQYENIYTAKKEKFIHSDFHNLLNLNNTISNYLLRDKQIDDLSEAEESAEEIITISNFFKPDPDGYYTLSDFKIQLQYGQIYNDLIELPKSLTANSEIKILSDENISSLLSIDKKFESLTIYTYFTTIKNFKIMIDNIYLIKITVEPIFSNNVK